MKKLILVASLLAAASPAWADGTINTLSAGGALSGTELIPMFQTSNPAVTTTPNALKTFMAIPAAANPTANIGTSAVNGSAATFMRSDGAPAIPQCSSSTFGACKVDGTSITASGGVISTALPTGANPTATAGAAAINGSAATFMRSDGAPALTAATTSTAGIAKLHTVPVSVGWIATVNPNNAVIAVINQASTVSAIIGAVETATGGTATVSVNKAASGTACSAGTTLHSGSFNANGTAATNQTLTVTTASLAAGDRLCLQTTGTTTWTTGTGIGTITVFLAPS